MTKLLITLVALATFAVLAVGFQSMGDPAPASVAVSGCGYGTCEEGCDCCDGGECACEDCSCECAGGSRCG